MTRIITLDDVTFQAVLRAVRQAKIVPDLPANPTGSTGSTPTGTTGSTAAPRVTPNPPTVTVPVPPPKFDKTIIIPMLWGPPQSPNPPKAFTTDFGGFGYNDLLVIKFTTPLVGSPLDGRLIVAASDNSIVRRTFCLSTIIGDFSGPNLGVGVSCGALFVIGGRSHGRTIALATDTVYYFNIKNEENGVPTLQPDQHAEMFVELTKPKGI